MSSRRSSPHTGRRRLVGFPFAAALLGTASWRVRAAPPGDGVVLRSGASVPNVVELYTSEGCSSCPPADAWLSTLSGGEDRVLAAFHVDYWDRLGWKDRFADAVFTRRQSRLQASSGARFVYTPQVLVDGADWRGWPDRPLPRPAVGTMALQAQRAGSQWRLRLSPLDRAPARVGGWWAQTESGHQSRVAAGENAGRTLRHDHVVRAYGELPVGTGHETRDLVVATATAAGPGAEAAVRRFVVVLTDDDSGRPVAALSAPF